MSRSRRRTPISAITTAKSEKKDKRGANGRLRAAIRAAVRDCREVMPALREVSNVWTFDKDGKRWWPGMSMRK